MMLTLWLFVFKISAEGNLGFMEGTEVYFLFVDANRIHYCKERLFCLDLKKIIIWLWKWVSGYRIEYTLHH